jgi:transposase
MQGLLKLSAIERLRRVWLQHYQFSEAQLQWRANDNLPPAGLMISSPYDEEARYARKGTTSWIGYKIHLTETCGAVVADTNDQAEYFDEMVSAELQDCAQPNEVDVGSAREVRELPHLITNVETTIACAGDVSVTASIHNHLHQQQLLPANHIVDTGFVDSRLVIESERDFKLNLVGPSRGDYRWQAQQGKGFAAANFEIDWQARKAHCPGGKESSSWSEGPDGRGKAVIKIKFAHRDCQGCVFRTDCTRSKLARRTITIRPQAQHEILQNGRKQQNEVNWKEMYQQRAGIEGTISQGVRGFGMRRTRYIGAAKTHLQHLATASALNLVRVVAWLDGENPAKTRTSHFAALKKVA